MSILLIRPLGSIVARDGRPFGTNAGVRMRLTPWLYPSVAAGSFRTLLGKELGGVFNSDLVKELKHISVAGPLPFVDDQLCFPAPKDIVLRSGETPEQWFRIRPEPVREGEGTDLPNCNLTPAMLDDAVGDFKPAPGPPWWQASRMIEWLLDVEPGTPGKPDDWRKRGFMTDPEHDLRTHLGMDNESGSGKEGMLFQTAGFQFRDDVRLAVRVEGTLGQKIGGIHPMGGERRLAAWINGGESSAWICPAEIAEEMRTGEYPRMILATPALFDDGWKPGWLDENLIGRIPGSECLVQLVSVCIDGWKPISGWSLEIGNSGEKPIRRIVPAGGVYFFRRIGSGEFPIEQLWLQPVSDCPQWRRDGFGLALWGKWTPTERGEERQ